MGVANPIHYVVKGNTKIIQLPDKRTWNLTDGIQTYRRFRGTSDAIKAKFNEFSSADSPGVDNMDEDIKDKSGYLICRILEDSGGEAGGNTEELNAVWELWGQDILKPIETHSDFDAITPERKRAIENYVRDAAQYPITLAAGAEKQLAGYLAYQVLDFPVTEMILRKSTTLSTKSSITASYANTNRVVTLASINPPTRLIGALTSLPLMSGSTGSWQWLKKTPQTRQITKRQFQLIYEWHGAERWAGIYGGTWTPTYS